MVLSIIANNALVGLVTSYFLKDLNSILKAIASALELVFTAVAAFLVLGIPIYWNTAVAVAVVSYAVVLYSRNPLVKQTSATAHAQNKAASSEEEDAERLLKDGEEV